MNKTWLAYMQITAGTLIGALAVNLFMVPNQLASGGMSGLLLFLHYVFGLPLGMTYFLANLPALFWLFRLYGWHGLLKTLWGIASFSVFLELARPLTAFAPTDNLMLATIYSGVLMGLGLGLAVRVGGSTGGSTPIAQIVHHYTGLSIGKFLLATDALILAFGAITTSAERILYGLIMTFVVMRLLQAVQEGFSTSRCLLIISESPDEVGQAIMREIRRGVTRLSGSGEYSGRPRPVLMCVVSETEVHRIKRLVLAADPDAFVVITDAREVAGRGFTLDTDIRRIPFWYTQRGA